MKFLVHFLRKDLTAKGPKYYNEIFNLAEGKYYFRLTGEDKNGLLFLTKQTERLQSIFLVFEQFKL